jgi:hypothetical protein
LIAYFIFDIDGCMTRREGRKKCVTEEEKCLLNLLSRMNESFNIFDETVSRGVETQQNSTDDPNKLYQHLSNTTSYADQ